MCIFWVPCGFFGIHVDFLRSMWVFWDPCGFIESHVDFSNRVDIPESTWILNNPYGFFIMDICVDHPRGYPLQSTWNPCQTMWISTRISTWIIHVEICVDIFNRAFSSYFNFTNFELITVTYDPGS